MKKVLVTLVGIFILGTLILLSGCDRDWTGKVKGVITETDTEEGIPGVTVTIHSEKNAFEITVLSDSTGAYEIDNARWGPNKLEVYHPRYETVSKYVDVVRDATSEVDFEIDRLREYVDPVLTVSVVNVQGDPINQAILDLYELKQTAYEYYFFLDTRITDESGTVEFFMPKMYEEEIAKYQLRIAALDYNDQIRDFALSWTNSKPTLTIVMENI